MKLRRCPFCGRRPRLYHSHTGQGWFLDCPEVQPYRQPFEHTVSVNGTTRSEVMLRWNGAAGAKRKGGR